MAAPLKKEPNKYAKNADIKADTPVKTIISVVGMVLMLVGIAGIGLEFFKEGGWVYFDGSLFDTKTPNTSVQTKIIQSSQAIMLETTGASPSITFSESNKSSSYSITAFRPQPSNRKNGNMLVNLFAMNAEGNTFPVDGVRIQTDNKFSDDIDEMDGSKFNNINEMFGIRSHNKLLMVERRTRKNVLNLNLAAAKIREQKNAIKTKLTRQPHYPP